MTKNIATVTKELILANPTMKNADILIELRKVHPEKSSVACIAWYKSAMKPNTKTGKKQVPVVVEKTLEEQLLEVAVQIEALQIKQLELQEEFEAQQEDEEVALQAEIDAEETQEA